MTKSGIGSIVGLCAVFASATAFADSPSCTTRAAEKNLAGAAKTSFMKKCATDATAACDAAAADKNLSGAAKTSFTKKCVADAK